MFSVFLVSTLLFISLSTCSFVQEVTFSREPLLCNVTDRILRGCSEDLGLSTGLMSCANICSQRENCIGASLDENGRCFLHQVCHNMDTCVVEDTNHRFWGKYCVHGTWDVTSKSCSCVNATSGPRCNVYPAKCTDLAASGYSFQFHQALLNPNGDGKTLYYSQCHPYSNTEAYTYILINTGSSFYNRTWNEYLNGFYVDQSNLWAGLRFWHEICKTGCQEVNIAFYFFDGAAGRGAVYRYLFLSDEASGFKLSYNSSTSTSSGYIPGNPVLGDCLGPLVGTSFSTWDMDNDGNSAENCAARAGSGWWYNSGCDNPCNFLGLGSTYSATKPTDELIHAVGLDMSTLLPNLQYPAIYLRI